MKSVFRTLSVLIGSIVVFASGGLLAQKTLTYFQPILTPNQMESGSILRGAALQMDDGTVVSLHTVAANKEGHAAACETTLPQDATFSARLIDTTIPATLTPGSVATITVRVQNTGTTTWFNDNTYCNHGVPLVHLGTAKNQDRASALYLQNGQGWLNPERIKMEELSVAPGENAIFTFDAQLPATDDFLREYFAVVVEGDGFGQWLDDTAIDIDLTVGSPSADLITLAQYYQKSGAASALTGEKEIEIDLSDQKLFVKVGEMVLTEYRISSGKASTPTITGNFKILFKDDVRISGLGIPYIMPNYMGFAGGGAYGLHALPSLSYDNGYFWTEAKNHIGIPVSHGCVRLLPDDAKTLYSFAEIGTKVTVHQ